MSEVTKITFQKASTYIDTIFNWLRQPHMMEGDVSGAGKAHHLLVKKSEPKISIIKATLDNYPCIQNMARFYVYDLS